MKAIHRKRLEKLAEHLESGQLGHTRFDFSTFNSGPLGQMEGPSVAYQCGYAGCALGECPILFKEDWVFDAWGDPMQKQHVDFGCSLDSARDYFGLSERSADHLFVPDAQYPEIFGGVVLGDDATRYQVAGNIRAFLAVKAKAKANT